MIAKRVPNRRHTSSVAKLIRYVVDARGQEDPMTWTRTADYILDTRNDGAKVGGVRVTNCTAGDPAGAAIEILLTQAQNSRSKNDKTYHLVISFPPGERPPLATLHAIEDSLVASIGYADHQRISAVHTDTDHLHVHVAINKVHPRTLRNVEPYYDMPRLMAQCDRLEALHGLQRTNHGTHQQRTKTKDQTRDDRARRYGTRNPFDDPRHVAGLRQSYLAAITERPEAESLDRVRTLSSVGVVRLDGHPQVLLPGNAPDHLVAGGTEHHDALRRPGDGALGQGSRSRASALAESRAGDMEAHAGRESLLGWIVREVAPAIAAASDWQSLHRELALHDLVIRPQGAGMALFTRDGRIGVKASQVDRAFSANALTRRFGAFEPPATTIAAVPTVKRYTAPPLHVAPDTAGLFARYQRELEGARAQRTQQRAALRSEHSRYSRELDAFYQRKRDAIRRGPLRGPLKKRAYAILAEEKKADLGKRRALERQQRAQLANLKTPAWADWLVAQANDGDPAAVAVLQSRAKRQARFSADWLRAPDAAAAKAVLFKHLKPRTDKSGTVHYAVADGGMVKDTTEGVRVDKPTDAAAFLGLLVAADKYAGQALIIDGSAAFRAQVARLAGEKGLRVSFADAELEAQRIAALPQPQALASTPAAADPLDAFIAARNAQRARPSQGSGEVPRETRIAEHRRWTPDAAGEATYMGRRHLSDGRDAVLLQRGDTVFVMPVTEAQAAKASTWRVGAAVRTDARGRFVGAPTPAPTRKPRTR